MDAPTRTTDEMHGYCEMRSEGTQLKKKMLRIKCIGRCSQVSMEAPTRTTNRRRTKNELLGYCEIRSDGINSN